MRPSGLTGVLATVHDLKLQPSLKTRLGGCYIHAFRFVEDYPDWSLVHGHLAGILVAVRDENGRYPHAWATKADMVYEPIHNRIYDVEFYRRRLEPHAEVTYTRDEMVRRSVEHLTYGPWHGDAPCCCCDQKPNPLDVLYRDALAAAALAAEGET